MSCYSMSLSSRQAFYFELCRRLRSGQGVAWMIMCTFFVALFLAFCKRRHELESLGANAAEHRGILKNYSLVFIDKMVSALASLTMMSYALYYRPSSCRESGDRRFDFITLPIVLFGIFRYLYIVHQEHKGGSPTEVMLKDEAFRSLASCT